MPRNDPTEGHPARGDLQLRAKFDALPPRDGRPWLHYAVELYERHGSKWSRLTCRTGYCTAEELLEGGEFLKGAADLLWHYRLDDEDPLP